MDSMRDIKSRIKSVGSTQKTTRAMNLVSGSKLQKAKNKLELTRPFFFQTQNVIANIVNSSKGIKHKYLVEREIKNTLIIVIANDRGLCGGYNVNICKAAATVAGTKENSASIFAIGNKSKDYFRRRGYKIVKSMNGISESPFYEDAEDVARVIVPMFENNEVDEVYLAYTEFKSMLSHEPKVIRILPVDTESFPQDAEKKENMNFVPDEETVLDYVIPKYLNTIIYGALVESAACGQGATMTAMDSATDNAGKIIDDLTLLYNRARQGTITQELTEIVGGASALE